MESTSWKNIFNFLIFVGKYKLLNSSVAGLIANDGLLHIFHTYLQILDIYKSKLYSTAIILGLSLSEK